MRRSRSLPRHFNSRPCMRGDKCGAALRKQNGRFQFTPLHEGRLGDVPPQKVKLYFNSRPCMRGDVRSSPSSLFST